MKNYIKGKQYKNKGMYLGTREIHPPYSETIKKGSTKNTHHLFSTGVYDGGGAVILFSELI